MHHSFVIALAILLFVGVSALFYDEPYLGMYDPFKILTPECKTGSGESTSCFFRKKAKENPNPYKQQQLWQHFFFGDMTVSVGKYFSQTEQKMEIDKLRYSSYIERKSAGCKRVLVFSVKGMVLDGVVVTKDCKDYNLTPQIMYLDNALWHYPDTRIKLDSSGKNVVVTKLKYEMNGNYREQGKPICEKKYYNLRVESSSTVVKAESDESMELDRTTDEDCKALTGQTGTFPVSSVISYHSELGRPEDIFSIDITYEPYLGIRFWKCIRPFCHWKLVIYLNEQPLTGMAMFCGESLFRDIVATKEVLRFGKNIMARSSPMDPTEVTILLNPRNGECIKHQYKLKAAQEKSKKPYPAKQSITTMHEPDQECKDFIEGKLTEQRMNRYDAESAIKQLQNDKVEVIPLFKNFMNDKVYIGPQLFKKKAYLPKDVNVHVSNGNDMDVLIIDNNRPVKWLFLVAKGVIIDVAAVNGMPSFSFTADTIVCESYFLIERDQKDENLFSILSRWDNSVCTRTRYVVINKDGKLSKQEIFPAEIGVTGVKCTLLLYGGKIYEPFRDNPTEILKDLLAADSDLAEYL